MNRCSSVLDQRAVCTHLLCDVNVDLTTEPSVTLYNNIESIDHNVMNGTALPCDRGS